MMGDHIPYWPCNDTFNMCDQEYEEFDEPFPPDFNRDEDEIAHYITNIMNIVILIITAISICANGLVLVIYYVMGRRSRKIPNFMLFNQAIVDTTICVYAFLGTLPYYVKTIFLLPYYKIVTIVLGHYTVFLALGILLLTAGERFLALKKPFFHRRYASKNKMIAAIVILYIIAFVPCLVYISFLDKIGEIHYSNFGMIYTSARLAVVFTGIIFVLAVLYFTLRTVKRSIRHSRTIRDPLTTGDVDDGRKERFLLSERKKEKKMMTIFITMATVFTVSYLPMAIFNTIKLAAESTESIRLLDMLIAEAVGFILYILSAFVNPLLTLSLKDDYKRHLFKSLKKRKDDASETKTELMSTSAL